jgi:hypothetical protein
MSVRLRSAVVLVPFALLAQQRPGMAPIKGAPVVEFKGKIERVRIAPGQGMPSLDVRRDEETVKVHLGSMRYLMEQNFNPKAGTEVSVKGYQVDKSIIAITIAAAGKVLRLRDEDGRPVWMGGRSRGGGNR